MGATKKFQLARAAAKMVCDASVTGTKSMKFFIGAICYHYWFSNGQLKNKQKGFDSGVE